MPVGTDADAVRRVDLLHMRLVSTGPPSDGRDSENGDAGQIETWPRESMNQMLAVISDQVRAFLRREGGQDTFEYMLIIGGVSAAVVVAIAVLAFGLPGIRTATCEAIGAISGYAGYSGCETGGGAGGPGRAGGQSPGSSGSGSAPGLAQPTGTPLPSCAPADAAENRDCVRR